MKATSRKEAKAASLIRYFTGKECPQGHIADRYTANSCCVQCKIEWPINNRDSVLATGKKRRANPEYIKKIRKLKSAWRKVNRAKENHWNSIRLAAIDNRTPPWANLKKIERIYMLASWASRFTSSRCAERTSADCTYTLTYRYYLLRRI